MNKIIIINKKDNIGGWKKFYIGRSSPLGNPFSIDSYFGTGCGRIAAVREYRIWLREMISKNDYAVMTELSKMREALMLSDIALECWCYPMMCHGGVIKEYLETGKI
jgi:hypothetical protein